MFAEKREKAEPQQPRTFHLETYIPTMQRNLESKGVRVTTHYIHAAFPFLVHFSDKIAWQDGIERVRRELRLEG
jgi:hypothetical protein